MTQKTAIIFGGTAGIGLATAKALCEDNISHLIISSRTEARGLKAAEELSSLYPHCHVIFMACDVSDHLQVQSVFDDAHALLTRIDIVISSISPPILPCLFKNSDPANYATLLNTALIGVMNICKYACDAMRPHNSGSIITIASDAAKQPTPGETTIGAVMAGIVMLSRTIALEEKRNGIRVNCLTPSIVQNTPLYDELMEDPFCKKLFQKAEEKANLGVVTAQEIADMAAFLVHEKARKITGQVISVNGGIST